MHEFLLDETDFLVAQTVQLVHKPVDLRVRGGDLTGPRGLLLRRPRAACPCNASICATSFTSRSWMDLWDGGASCGGIRGIPSMYWRFKAR